MSSSYYEKQYLRRCGLHAVNNFLQKEEYKREHFEQFSNELKQQSQQNHCTYFIGNYDVNIIELALQKKNYTVEWIKPQERNQQSVVKILEQFAVKGLILNLVKPQSWTEKLLQWEPRHWVSIRKFESSFYCYDSNQQLQVKEFADFVPFLLDLLKNKENYALVISEQSYSQIQQMQFQQIAQQNLNDNQNKENMKQENPQSDEGQNTQLKFQQVQEQ